MLKKNLAFLDSDTFEGSFDTIVQIFDIIEKVENLLLNNDLYFINNVLDLKDSEQKISTIDPEEPIVHKAARAIDQINKETGLVFASYKSLEAAGRAIGVTGSAIGIALRNKKLCQGYMFRYAGISAEDQYADQPVIKINCSDGSKIKFENMAEAAKECNISAPALRNRILTKVHTDNYHWIFDKSATHYIENLSTYSS